MIIYVQSDLGDELGLIGHPIDDLDLVISALNGLSPSFREFTVSSRTRETIFLYYLMNSLKYCQF